VLGAKTSDPAALATRHLLNLTPPTITSGSSPSLCGGRRCNARRSVADLLGALRSAPVGATARRLRLRPPSWRRRPPRALKAPRGSCRPSAAALMVGDRFRRPATGVGLHARPLLLPTVTKLPPKAACLAGGGGGGARTGRAPRLDGGVTGGRAWAFVGRRGCGRNSRLCASWCRFEGTSSAGGACSTSGCIFDVTRVIRDGTCSLYLF